MNFALIIYKFIKVRILMFNLQLSIVFIRIDGDNNPM